MRANQELTQEEFLEQKAELLQEKGGIQDKLGDNNNSADIWLELCTKYLNNAFSARETMENGTPEEKRNLILDLGQNLILKDKKLEFSFKKPYDVLLLPKYSQSMLALLNTFRTYEWTKPYQPLDYSFKYMQQILYAQQLVSNKISIISV